MGIFGNKKNERKLSFGLGGYVFKADDEYISYKSMYGKSFRVLKSDIEGVSLDDAGMGKNKIKINGRGTTLADVDMPKPWAEKVQDFIRSELSGNKTTHSGSLDELEKLSELKNKGVITQEEFDIKKKKLLDL